MPNLSVRQRLPDAGPRTNTPCVYVVVSSRVGACMHNLLLNCGWLPLLGWLNTSQHAPAIHGTGVDCNCMICKRLQAACISSQASSWLAGLLVLAKT